MDNSQSESAILKFIFKIFYIFGFWPDASSTPKYWILSFFFNNCLSTLLIASMTINLILSDDINEMTNSLVTTLTGIAYFVKAVNFYYYYDSIKACITELALFEHDTFEEVSLTVSRKKLLNTFGFVYYVGGYITIMAMVSIPFFVAEPLYPVADVWYPFEWKTNRINFIIAYIHQVLSIMLILSLNIGFDLYSYYLMGMISVQFQILGMRLRNLGGEISTTVNSIGNTKLDKIIESKANDTEELRNCVRIHQDILR